jgi:hypothetical protein
MFQLAVPGCPVTQEGDERIKSGEAVEVFRAPRRGVFRMGPRFPKDQMCRF